MVQRRGNGNDPGTIIFMYNFPSNLTFSYIVLAHYQVILDQIVKISLIIAKSAGTVEII